MRCAFIIKLEAKRKIKAASEFFIEREREREGSGKCKGGRVKSRRDIMPELSKTQAATNFKYDEGLRAFALTT